MKLCPVDVQACDRPYCRAGHCELAEERALVICWECGALDTHGIVHGICIECVTLRRHSPPAPHPIPLPARGERVPDRAGEGEKRRN